MNQPSWIDPGHAVLVPDGGAAADAGDAVQQIDLRKLWATIYRDRYIILAVFVAMVVGAIVLTILTRPRYTAVASVQIEQQTAKVLGSEDPDSASLSGSIVDADRFLQTQIDILKSRSLATRVASSLHLEQGDRFFAQMGTRPPRPKLGIDLRADRHEQILKLLTRNLVVDLPRNSRVTAISFISPDPRMAAQVANTFADNFIVANLQRRYDTTAYARDFLERRLNDVRERLQNSEREMIGYARQAQLIDASNAATTSDAASTAAVGPKSLTVAELVQLDSATTQAQTARVAAEQRWLEARKTPLMDLPEVQSNPTIQALMQQRSQLVAAYQEERQRRTPAYPSMVQEAARITELDSQIKKVATNVRDAIEGAFRTAQSQEKSLQQDVVKLKSDTLAEQNRGIRYNILKRDVDTNRALYDGLLQRYKEVSAEAGVTTNNISIVDRADVPLKPTSPNLGLNVALALLLAAITSAAVVFAREKLDDRIRAPEDVANKLGVPLLGTVPLVPEGSSPLELLEQPRSDLSEAYQALRGALDLSTPEGAPRTLLITSSKPAEGKSTTSYAIARSLAKLGRKVVLVDADMRRPSLHRTLGFNNQAGLSGLLAHQQRIEDVTRKTEIENLDFIASGTLPPNPAELLTTNILSDLLNRMRLIYDIIVIDGPPVLGLADAVQLASAVEGTAFVVAANSGQFGGVKTSLRRLASANQPIVGVILNKFDLKRAAYSYSYAYNYEYSYSAKEGKA